MLGSDEMRARMQEQGVVGGSGSPAEFALFVQREQERYAAIVKKVNIKE